MPRVSRVLGPERRDQLRDALSELQLMRLRIAGASAAMLPDSGARTVTYVEHVIRTPAEL